MVAKQHKSTMTGNISNLFIQYSFSFVHYIMSTGVTEPSEDINCVIEGILESRMGNSRRGTNRSVEYFLLLVRDGLAE